MRIWSVHPKYLDAKGLVALWREALLAKNVLEEKTKGYKNHPQLDRFKKSKNPVAAINYYLAEVYAEALDRNYNFNKEKLNWNLERNKLTVNKGQFAYELKHLQQKLEKRDLKKYEELNSIIDFAPHPMFEIVDGPIEDWEVI